MELGGPESPERVPAQVLEGSARPVQDAVQSPV